MHMNKNKRPQKPKPVMPGRNEEFALATRTRHAASARPHRLKTAYTRKAKHKGREF